MSAIMQQQSLKEKKLLWVLWTVPLGSKQELADDRQLVRVAMKILTLSGAQPFLPDYAPSAKDSYQATQNI